MELFDQDNLTTEKIGRAEIDVSKCFNNPNTWQINNIFKMEEAGKFKFPENAPKPEVYVQMLYLPEGESLWKKTRANRTA